MANIATTTHKVTGSHKAVNDLWNTLQKMEVNSKNVWLYQLAEHYGIDYEKKGISVRGHIYWAEFEADEANDYYLLSFDTESAWDACSELFEEINHVLGDQLSISYRVCECGSVRSIMCMMKVTSSPKRWLSVPAESHLRMLVMTSTPPSKMLSMIGVRRCTSSKVSELMRK